MPTSTTHFSVRDVKDPAHQPARPLWKRPEPWVFLLIFGLRLWTVSMLIDSPYFLPDKGDMRFYHEWALRVLGGRWTDHQAFYGLPGYPWMLAGIYSVFGDNPFMPGLFQALSEAAVGVFIYQICKIVFSKTRGEMVGILASVGWGFFQPAQAFSCILMPTTWVVLALWGGVWCLLRTESRSVWRPWLWIGLMIGAVAMVVATILFLIPLVLVAAAMRLRRPAAIAVSAAVVLAGVLVGLSPCALHNYLVAGEPVLLSAHSGVNFYIGNNANANGYPKIPPGMRASQEGMLQDSITMAERAAGRKLSRTEVSQIWAEKARAHIRSHPVEWLGLMGKKLRNFWSAYQYDDLSIIPMLRSEGIITPGLTFGLVAAFALPGILLAVRRFPRSWWVLAAVLLHMAALLPVFVTERYRLAAVPGLLVFAAFAVVELAGKIAAFRWRAVAAQGALTCAAATVVAWPYNDTSLLSRDPYNTGIKLTDAGRLDAAQRNLDLAFSYVPDNAEINFALGNLWLEKGDRYLAKRFYRRAIELDPRHASALNNLGVLAMEEKRWELAGKFFAASLGIENDNAKGHYLMAKARLALGERALALREAEAAYSLRPEQPEFRQFRDELAAPVPPVSE